MGATPSLRRLLAPLLVAGIQFGCSTATTTSGEELVDSAARGISVAPHVQYYGYFCDSCVHVGDRDYMADIADHSNFSFILHSDHGGVEVEKLDAARALGLQGILNVSSVFALSGCSGPVSDYRWRWEAYARTIRPKIDDVIAFYLADEPELRVFPYLCHLPPEAGVPWPTVKAQLEEIIDVIHASFPGVPVMVNYSQFGALHELPAPANADWLGFFCYGPWDNCMGTGASVPEMLERVKRASQPHQRLFLIPEATSFYYDSAGVPLDVPSIEANAPRYAQLASSEPRVIALLTFLWQSVDGAPAANSLPGVAARYREIGRAITRRGNPPPPPPPPPPGNLGEVVGVLDGVVDINGELMLQGWACGRGVDQSISVHLYLGGPAGIGTIVDGYLAANPSEPAVAAACGANGANYRFWIPMAPLHEAHAGQTIFVHGISPTGRPNLLLNASGQFTVP